MKDKKTTNNNSSKNKSQKVLIIRSTSRLAKLKERAEELLKK